MTITTRPSANHEVYALARPLVYQLGALGGHERETRIDWSADGDGATVISSTPTS